jgi:hypothetical protein
MVLSASRGLLVIRRRRRRRRGRGRALIFSGDEFGYDEVMWPFLAF